MGDYLLQLWNMSYQAGLVIVMILLARLVFSLIKVPKKFSYILWTIPFFRMICPWVLESPFSLLPKQTGSINDMFLQKVASYFQNAGEAGNLNPTGNAASTLLLADHETQSSVSAAHPAVSGNPNISFQSFLPSFPDSITPEMIMGAIWLSGILLLFLYSVISCWNLKKKLVCSICIRENIYLADHIDTPFIMGISAPRIYLPSHIYTHQMDYVIAHERVHIRRKDHLFKSLAFIITCLHWFNPLAWIAFIYMNKDMEMSCDEAVLQQFGDDRRREYATALLELTAGAQKLSGIWLAFGKGNTKERIVNIMKHKKPMTFLVILAGLAVIVLAAVLLTNPRESYTSNEDHAGQTDETSVMNAANPTDDANTALDKITPMEPYLFADTSLGADGPTLYYSDKNTIIFHGYFGLFVYSLSEQKLLRAVDVASIGCDATQGDAYCEIHVASDGSEVYLHPMNQKFLYAYNVSKNELSVQTSNLDGIDLFNQPVSGQLKWEGDSVAGNLYYENGDTKIKLFDGLPTSTSNSDPTFGSETAAADPSAEPEQSHETDENLLDSSIYGLEIQEDTLTQTGATILIHNRSQKVIEYGDSYHLSRLENDDWVDVSYVIENWGFHDIAYTLPSGQTSTVEIDWEWLYGSLPSGTYLLTKTINVPKSDGTYTFVELGIHFKLK